MIKNIIIIMAIVIVLGIGIVGFLLYQPSENSYVDDNKMKFTQQQADRFIAEIDNIASPIFAEGWKWSNTEYKQAKKLIAEKDSTLNNFTINDQISKTELNKVENYSKKMKLKLEATYNFALIKKTNQVIESTEFDFLIASNLLTVIPHPKNEIFGYL